MKQEVESRLAEKLYSVSSALGYHYIRDKSETSRSRSDKTHAQRLPKAVSSGRIVGRQTENQKADENRNGLSETPQLCSSKQLNSAPSGPPCGKSIFKPFEIFSHTEILS